MSTVVEIKKAIETLAPLERDDLAKWLLESAKPKTGRDEIHPDVLKMTGLVPKDVDVKAEFQKHHFKKHQ
ncbi:MAG: hypothetical protein ABI042_02025 [Verrucomicrobiota bacterium]